MKDNITKAKYLAIASFLVLLFVTYFLRSEVLALNTIRFQSENIRSDESVRELKESQPMRMAEYELSLKEYGIQKQHYEEMMELYRTDYDEYVKRTKDKYSPPALPRQPNKPASPELSDQLAENRAAFRKRQYEYFKSTSRLNWVACLAAMSLVGGLLYLLMFDQEGKRIFYLAVLVLSFVFMIGPSFHSILSGIIGLMNAP